MANSRSGRFPVSVWLTITAALALIGISAAAAFSLLGPERVWAMFGPADLGPVDFHSLQRPGTATDALAAPFDVTTAKIDISPPIYPMDAAALRRAFARAITLERRLTLVDIDDETATERYIQRSEKLRFPDTIVVRFLERPQGQSTIAVYSRSQIGRNDLGVNRARIERWLDRLSQEVAITREVSRQER